MLTDTQLQIRMRDHLAVEEAMAETALYQVTLTCGGQSFPVEVSSSHGPTSLESRIQEVCGIPPGREPILSLPSSAWQVARQVVVTSSTGPSLHLSPPLRLSSDVEVCEGWQCRGGGGDCPGICAATQAQPWFVLGDGRCFARSVIHQLTRNGQVIWIGNLRSNPRTNYRTDDDPETLTFLGAAMRVYAQRNLEYVRHDVPPEVSQATSGEGLPTMYEEAQQQVQMYENAHYTRALYDNVIGGELYATMPIILGAAMFHGVAIQVRSDYRRMQEGKVVLDTRDRRGHDQGRLRTVNEGGQNGALFVNNILLDGIGHHFELQQDELETPTLLNRVSDSDATNPDAEESTQYESSLYNEESDGSSLGLETQGGIPFPADAVSRLSNFYICILYNSIQQYNLILSFSLSVGLPTNK